MSLILFLILFPLVIGFTLLFISNDCLRNIIVKISAVILATASLALAMIHFPNEQVFFSLDLEIINTIMLIIEILIGVYIFYASIKYKKYLVTAIISIQLALMTFFEIFKHGHEVIANNNLFIDKFSVIMALIIGIIGSLICVYALGYMKDFHEQYHKELKDNRKFFFFIIFIFLSSMFGIIFSNNLLWLFFFWEITTLCSFLLIGYKKNQESINNSFRALTMNLLGGIAFSVGIIYLFVNNGVIELDQMLQLGSIGILLPLALFSFAGITKSAQIPFCSWLTGAMVAPTPVSALLHSSTMVKAGVYLIIRLAPSLRDTNLGLVVALIGGVTFLITSLIAVSQNDAKKVLAYSTIANLGLIVMCGGIGTAEAVWAGILLIIFHAIAKCLLFLCVGIIEHKVGSRNIESMSGLIIKMPKISIMVQIGIAGMFLAPFGMLVSKWAVLEAVVVFNPLLVIFVVFGSAPTLFFWIKWMGKLIEVTDVYENVENKISLSEWIPLFVLSFLTIAVCMSFPVVSYYFIEPYLIEVYGHAVTMAQGNFIIMIIMLAMLALFPLSFIRYGKKVKVVDAYLGGANADSSTNFHGSIGAIHEMKMENYYLSNYFVEKKLIKSIAVIGIILILIMFGVSF